VRGLQASGESDIRLLPINKLVGGNKTSTLKKLICLAARTGVEVSNKHYYVLRMSASSGPVDHMLSLVESDGLVLGWVM
jgi:hypothetical protein